MRNSGSPDHVASTHAPFGGHSVDSEPAAGRNEIRCSLIVVNFNAHDLLLKCVESLHRAASANDEIIVVDNGSTDGSAEAIERDFPNVIVVRLPTNRYIFGLNDGLLSARGEYVAFCNNDMIVEGDFVNSAISQFTTDDIFAVCPRVLDSKGHEQGTRTAGAWKHGLLVYIPLEHSSQPTHCFFAVGGQSFYRRRILLEIGSIDELLWPMYHEDIELSYRAWRCGYRIVYAPESVCQHLGGATSRRVFTPTQLRSFVRQNEMLMVWKDVADGRMLIQHFAYLLPRMAAALLRRDWGTVLGMGQAIMRARGALLARRLVRPGFRRSDREVLRMVSAANIAHFPLNAP